MRLSLYLGRYESRNKRSIMFRLIGTDMYIIGVCFEGFCYGLYSAIFVIYLHHRCSAKRTNSAGNILFCLLCALYVLSSAAFVGDIIVVACEVLSHTLNMHSLRLMGSIQIAMVGFCDFISQFILIYRCWIVWGNSIRIVIIPSILAFTFLATWLASNGSTYFLADPLMSTHSASKMILPSLAMSLIVNALVTGLIVFRIYKVFQEIKTSSADNQTLGVTGGITLRRVIFILIESGMVLFSIQMVRFVLTIVPTEPSYLLLFIGVQQMLNGISPTIILVRVSMGLSFHNEDSLVEVVASLQFTPDIPNPIPRIESNGVISNVHEESGDDIESQGGIQMVAR